MIIYKKTDGTTDALHSNDCSIEINHNTNTFTLRRTIYGYDEYDFYEDVIEDITELKID